jgi:CBS domain containing-hemolysin-like protein
MELILVLLACTVGLVLAGLFAAAEHAYLTANKFQVALRERDRDRPGRFLRRVARQPARFLAMLLVGFHSAYIPSVLGADAVLESALNPLVGLGEWNTGTRLLAQIVGFSVVTLALAEYTPKAIARNRPLQVLAVLSPLLQVLWWALRPVVWVTDGLTRLLMRALGAKTATGPDFTKEDLQRYLTEAAETTGSSGPSEQEAEMFRNALDFNETEARAFMVPRTDIVALNHDATVPELHLLLVRTELSRVLVYDRTLDDVLGYVHASALFARPQTIAEVLQPVFFIPETMTADLLLREFHVRHMSVAVVVDEFGGTAGLATLEDLVEVIFGDIEDEYDALEAEEWIMERLGDRTFRFAGRVPVEDANEEYDLQLPLGEYSTLGGLFLEYAEEIPVPGQEIELPEGYRLRVERATPQRIETLTVEAPLLPVAVSSEQ